MARLRIYQSPVIGDGKTLETARRPKVSLYNVSCASLFKEGQFFISLVRADDFTALDQDPEIRRLSRLEAVRLIRKNFGPDAVVMFKKKGWRIEDAEDD